MIRAILTSGSMRSLRHKPDRSCATKPGHISCHRQRRSLSAVQRSWPGLFYPRTHTDEPSIWELFAYMTRQTVAARVPEGHVVNSQEREIISGIFKRLEQAANQPRDPETERFINDKIRSQPYAHTSTRLHVQNSKRATARARPNRRLCAHVGCCPAQGYRPERSLPVW